MADNNDHVGLDIFIDVNAKPGQLNSEALIRAIVTELSKAKVPIFNPAIKVKVDEKAVAGQYTAQIAEAIKKAEKGLQAQITARYGEGTPQAAVATQTFNRSRAALERTLGLLTQGHIESHFSAVNEQMLRESAAALQQGRRLSTRELRNIARFTRGSEILAKQVGSIASEVSSTKGPSFAAPLFDLSATFAAAKQDFKKLFSESSAIRAEVAKAEESAYKESAKRARDAETERKKLLKERYKAEVAAYAEKERRENAAWVAEVRAHEQNKKFDEDARRRREAAYKLEAQAHAENARRDAAAKKAADEKERHLKRIQSVTSRISELEGKLAGGKGTDKDFRNLGRYYDAMAKEYEKRGLLLNAEEMRNKAADVRNPAAATRAAIRQIEAAHGQRVLQNVGGVGNIGLVDAENAGFVKAHLRQQQFELGHKLLTTSDPGERDRLRKQIDDLTGSMHKLDAATGRTTGTVAQFFRYAIGYGALYQALAAVGALARGVTDLEKSLVSMKAVSGATDSQMVSVAAAIREVGRTSKYSLTEVTDAAKILAQAGVSADKMGTALKNVTNLASAIEAPIAVVADLMTSMREIFSKESDASLANQLASAVNISKLTAEGLQTIIGLSANVAESMQLSSEQYLAAVATLKNAGLKDSTVATGLRQLMLELNAPDDKLVEAFRQRYRAMGEDMTKSGVRDKLYDMFSGPDGLVKALTELQRLGYNAGGRQTFARAFDIRSQNALEALIRDLPQLIQNQTSIGFSQAATIGSQQQLQTIDASLTRLKNSFILLGDSIGKDALPPLIEFIDYIGKAVNGLADLNDQIIARGGSGFGAAVGSGLLGGLAGFAATKGNLAAKGMAAAKGGAAGLAVGGLDMVADDSGNGALSTAATAASYGLLAWQVASLASTRIKASRVWQNRGGKNLGPAADGMEVAEGVGNALAFGSMLKSMWGVLGNAFRIGINFLKVNPIIAVVTTGITLLAMLFKASQEEENKAADLKRRLNTSGQLALEKTAKYAEQKASLKELDITDRVGATGLASEVVRVQGQRAENKAALAQFAGNRADEVSARLAQIAELGGVSSVTAKHFVNTLRRDFESFKGISDAQLSELATAAAEAETAPQAIADKLSQMYAQLKEMNPESLTAGQEAFVRAFEKLNRQRDGFGKSSIEQMANIEEFFTAAKHEADAGSEKTKAAEKEAITALKDAEDAIQAAVGANDFVQLRGAISNFATAWHNMGKSAADELDRRADALEKTLPLLTGSDRQAAEDLILAQRGEAARLRGQAKKANISLVGEVAALGQQYESFTGSMTPEQMAKVRGTAGLESALKLAKSPLLKIADQLSPEMLAALIKQETGLDAKADMGAGEGRISLGDFADKAKQGITNLATEKERIDEEERRRKEAAAERDRLAAEMAYDDEIAGAKARISKANTLSELSGVLGLEGGANSFSELRNALGGRYAAKLGNVQLEQGKAALDLRNDPTFKDYKRLDKETLENLRQYRVELAKIKEQEDDLKRRYDIAASKAREKMLADQIKAGEKQIEVLISTAASVDDLSAAMEKNEALHRSRADAIHQTTMLETGDAQAASAAARAYEEQNTGIEKRLGLLQKLSSQVSANAADRRAGIEREVTGLTAGELAYRKGKGATASLAERDQMQLLDLSIYNKEYDEQSAIRRAMAAKRDAAAKRLADAQVINGILGIADSEEKLTAEVNLANQALKEQDRVLDGIAEKSSTLQADRERNTLKGMFEYSTGIGESGAKTNMANLANDQLANAWAEGGEKLRGGIVSSIDAIGEAFVRAKLNGESFRDAFKGIINGVAVDLASFFAKKAVWWFLMSFLGGFGGKGADIGTTSQLFSNDWSTAAARGGTLRFSGGGMIRGPGTGTSDSIPGLLVDGNRTRPLLLSNGESVLTARATRMLGADTITAINRGAVRAQSLRYQQAGTKVAQTTTTTQNNLEIHVPVNIESGAGQSDINAVVAQQLGEKVKMKVRETMIEEARPGGLLYRR